MKKAIVLITVLLFSCGPKCPNAASPKYHKGEKVKMAASKFKQAVIIDVELNENTCSYVYSVSYFTLWETRRLKIVTEQELEPIH